MTDWTVVIERTQDGQRWDLDRVSQCYDDPRTAQQVADEVLAAELDACPDPTELPPAGTVDMTWRVSVRKRNPIGVEPTEATAEGALSWPVNPMRRLMQMAAETEQDGSTAT